MQLVWESRTSTVKVLDGGDRYIVVDQPAGAPTKLVTEYWKDGGADQALKLAVEHATKAGNILLG